MTLAVSSRVAITVAFAVTFAVAFAVAIAIAIAVYRYCVVVSHPHHCFGVTVAISCACQLY